MKLKVFGEDAEEVTRLRLFRCTGDAVELHVVDEDGAKVRNGCVCRLSSDGLDRLRGFGCHFGFPMDSAGRIALQE